MKCSLAGATTGAGIYNNFLIMFSTSCAFHARWNPESRAGCTHVNPALYLSVGRCVSWTWTLAPSHLRACPGGKSPDLDVPMTIIVRVPLSNVLFSTAHFRRIWCKEAEEDSALDFKTAPKSESSVNIPLAFWKRRVDITTFTLPTCGGVVVWSWWIIHQNYLLPSFKMLPMCYVFAVQPKEPLKIEVNK